MTVYVSVYFGVHLQWNCNVRIPSQQKSSPDLMFVMTLIWIKENTADIVLCICFWAFQKCPYVCTSVLGSLSVPCGPPFSFLHSHSYITEKFLPFLSFRIENTFYFDQANHILYYKCDQQTNSLSGTTSRLWGLFFTLLFVVIATVPSVV